MPKVVRPDGFIDYSGWWWKLARPVVIVALHGILVVVACWRALARGASAIALAGALASGYALWTLFEYALHRWLLHHRRFRPLQALFWKQLHKEHHQYRNMRDPDHHGVHVAISLPLAMLVLLAAPRTALGLGLAAGWILGYLAYEALHWLFHSGDPQVGLGRLQPVRALWDAHTVHHLVSMNANYGFVTVMWDRVFRTYRPAIIETGRASRAPRDWRST